MPCLKEYVPTPAEIAAATATIQKSWTPQERERRRTTITDLEKTPQRTKRCGGCGSYLRYPHCVYCACKSRRRHSPISYAGAIEADRHGEADAFAHGSMVIENRCQRNGLHE